MYGANFEAYIFSENEECLLEVGFSLPTAELSIYDLRSKLCKIVGNQSFQIYWKDHMNSRRNVDCDSQFQVLLAEKQDQLVSMTD